MTVDQESHKPDHGHGNWKITLLLCIFILMLGAGFTTLIFFTEPTATRTGATKESAMLVEITEVERGNFRPTVVAMGSVKPAQDIILRPRVSGEVIELSEEFAPGGYVSKGDILLQIDPADYENTLQQRKSELHQAQADLEVEQGRQDVAKQDYQLIEEKLSPENEALILRQPQLNAVKARVESARAAVQQAELDLQRTTIKAPFDAHILTRSVNVGSQVSPSDALARLVGVDHYWIETTVPVSDLRWISFPGDSEEQGTTARIRNRTAWAQGEYRTGYVYKLIGALEERTRMARVLVTVPDPLEYRATSPDKPPLIIGAYVEVSIQASEIEDVLRLNRDYVRKDDTVWVMVDGVLRIRNVDIVYRDAKYAYIASGLNEDDRVVTTNLTTVVDGAKLRLKSDDLESDEALQTKTAQKTESAAQSLGVSQ